MRDLFSELSPTTNAPPRLPGPADDQRPDAIAKEFVRWCCSFGTGFRNSPDIANLRFWVHKTKLKLKEHEEFEVLDAARVEFLKHIEHLVKKSETAN